MTERANDSPVRESGDAWSYEGESGLVGEPAMDTGARRTPEERRIGALDGIRGVAILLVLMHNTGTVRGDISGPFLRLWAVVANAGWIGVQLFFALSGFLITRILLDSRGAPGSLRSFYVRRLLRIAPLYYVTLVVIFGIAPHVPAIAPLAETRQHGPIWYWLYLSNWISPWGGGARGLPHVWSLAVEEQFYLFWPLLIALLSDRAIGVLCAMMVAGAIAFRALLTATLPEHVASGAAYTFTITRWDAIALGALVALAIRTRRRPASPGAIAGLLAACAAGLLAVLAVEHGLSPNGAVANYVTMPLTGAASALLVLVCVLPEHETPPAAATGRILGGIPRVLGSRPLAWIGKYSYAIYVFHMPLNLALGGYVEPTLETGSGTVRFVKLVLYVAAIFTASSLLAVVSWKILEQPMLSLKRHFPTPVGATARVSARRGGTPAAPRR